MQPIMINGTKAELGEETSFTHKSQNAQLIPIKLPLFTGGVHELYHPELPHKNIYISRDWVVNRVSEGKQR